MWPPGPDLVSTSRANLSTQKRIHQAALALLAAPGFPQLLEAVTTDLAVHLEVDAVALCVEAVEGAPNRVPMGGISILKPGTDLPFGYGGYFADPDGHPWEVCWNEGFPFGPDGKIFIE